MPSDNSPEKSIQDILGTLKDITSAVMYAAEGRTLEQVLERVAEVSRDLVNARYAALGVPDGRGGLKYFKVAGMSPDEVRQMSHLPTGRGLLGTIMQERRTIRLDRMQDDPRSSGFCDGHPTMTSFLGVPVQVGRQLFGQLYLADREDGQPFTEEDAQLVEMMAGYAALAIAGAQLGEQQSRLNVLEERQRIGMELHDGVIQALYAIGMHLDLMRTVGSTSPGELGDIITDLNTVIEDIRRYIMNLKRDEHKTVHRRFQDIVERLHVPRSIDIQMDVPDEQPPFTQSTFEAICQIANEAVSNAVRHADAGHIRIKAQEEQNFFQIIIADDGKGFDPDNHLYQQGLGLQNIRHRARLYGGQVNIQSAPGSGTVLTITIPTRVV